MNDRSNRGEEERKTKRRGEGGNGERGNRAVTAAAMLVVMATAGESR